MPIAFDEPIVDALDPSAIDLTVVGLTPGQRVRVVGIVARPEMNGMEGVVAAWDDAQSRWRVRMSDGSGKLLKPTNLEVLNVAADEHELASVPANASTPQAIDSQTALHDALAPGQRVEIVGLQSCPELNGAMGVVVELDAGQGRWKVRMDDGSGKMMKASNLQAIENFAASPTVPEAAVLDEPDPSEAAVPVAALSPGQRVRVVGIA